VEGGEEPAEEEQYGSGERSSEAKEAVHLQRGAKGPADEGVQVRPVSGCESDGGVGR